MKNSVVTDSEIERAETDIFDNEGHFNLEQRSFLKCLDPCCVQAYAGTGKTSAVVGKLHVLAQKNAWQNGRGICVISHTNVAVEEIKNHVAKHYPAIMQYPNFVGTIQEFANKFLFAPYLADKNMKIRFQDERRYLDEKNFPKDLAERIKNHKFRLSKSPESDRALKDFYERLKTVFIAEDKLYARSKGIGVDEYDDLKTSKFPQAQVVDLLGKVIRGKHDEGSFLFIESFVYGDAYLKQRELVKDIIAQCFQFVFLDEAQDCSRIQLKILNALFHNNSKIIFQQVGDMNQAISEGEWEPLNFLTLSSSVRFGCSIVGFINKFKVSGGSGVSGTTEETKKYLIVYGEGKEADILQKFAEIINSESINTDKGCYAVSYRHEHLKKYFPMYSKSAAKNKNKKTTYYFDNDIEYIEQITKERIQQQGAQIVSEVLASLLHKHYGVGINSWHELRALLRIGEKASDFRNLIVKICNDVLLDKRISDLSELEKGLNYVLGVATIKFGHKRNISPIVCAETIIPNNVYTASSGVNIKIGTIHSVKGQTHAATLFFSNRDTKQDIQHALDCTPKRTKEYKRLLYVAASRPKYLFGFAIGKDAFMKLTDQSCFDDFNKIEI